MTPSRADSRQHASSRYFDRCAAHSSRSARPARATAHRAEARCQHALLLPLSQLSCTRPHAASPSSRMLSAHALDAPCRSRALVATRSTASMEAPSDACITRGMPRQHARARLCVRHHVATTWPPAQYAHDLRCMQRGEWALIVRALCFAELAGCCGVVRRVSPQSVQTLCTVAHETTYTGLSPGAGGLSYITSSRQALQLLNQII